MANDIYLSAVTGLTPLIQLYSGSTPIGAPFSAIEIGTTGEYVADMPVTPYGRYLLIAYVGTNVKIASGDFIWDGNYEVLESLGMLEGLNPNTPMTVTPNSRVAGSINLVITGDGETNTVVTRV